MRICISCSLRLSNPETANLTIVPRQIPPMLSGMTPNQDLTSSIAEMRIKFLSEARQELIDCNQYYIEAGGQVLARRMLLRIKKPILALRRPP